MIFVEVKVRSRKDYTKDPNNWLNIGYLSYLSLFEDEPVFAQLVGVVHHNEALILQLAQYQSIARPSVDDIERLETERRKGPHHVYEHHIATMLDLIAGPSGLTRGISDRLGIHICPNPNLTMRKAVKHIEVIIKNLENCRF